MAFSPFPALGCVLLLSLAASAQEAGAPTKPGTANAAADTLRLFEGCLDDLQEMAAHVLENLSTNQARRLRASISSHLEGDASDVLHEAALIGARTGGGRPQDVTGLRSLLRYGLWVVLRENWISMGEH